MFQIAYVLCRLLIFAFHKLKPRYRTRHRPAPIHHNGLPRNLTRSRGEQKQHRIGNIFSFYRFASRQ